MRLFSEDLLAAGRRRIAMDKRAQAAGQAMRQRLENWQATPKVIPDSAGGWIHNYVCPTHWLPLNYRPDSPHEHECPAGHTLSGESYDAAWRVWRHREMADLARDAALLHALDGGGSHRQVTMDILEQYAIFYDQFQGQVDAEPWMLKGHAFHQALTEALWAAPLIQAYDLVQDELSSGQRRRLARMLWRPLAEVMVAAQEKLVAQERIHSNYMAWIDAVLGLLGFVLDDDQLLTRALDGPAGFRAHLEQAILADSFEYEATPYYHNFVLLAYLLLAEASVGNGVDLYALQGPSGQSIQKMGLVLARIAWPDGALPDLSDGSYWPGSIYAPELYQSLRILHSRMPHPEPAWLLRATLAQKPSPERLRWTQILYELPQPEGGPRPPQGHTVLPYAGIALLRHSRDLAVCLPFGPHRASHHHFDRLSLNIWPFAQDPGCPLYGAPARRDWYQQSYAHNTVVVDSRSHAPSGGRLVDWQDGPAGCHLTLAAPDAYPGIHFQREVRVTQAGVEDRTTLKAGERHVYDWLLHVDGQLVLPSGCVSLDEPLGKTGAAAFIHLQRRWISLNEVSIHIRHGDRRYRVTLKGENPFDLLIGSAPGRSWDPQRRRHTLIARTQGRAQRYLARFTVEKHG